MKKIINRKVYNTETAEELASYSNNLGGSDFKNYAETLYKTKNGAYFLAGEGGPMSKYAEAVASGGWNNGSDIIPLSKKDAEDWAEQYAPDLFDTEFADAVTEA